MAMEIVVIPLEREDREQDHDLHWRKMKKRRTPWWRRRGPRRATCRSLSWFVGEGGGGWKEGEIRRRSPDLGRFGNGTTIKFCTRRWNWPHSAENWLGSVFILEWRLACFGNFKINKIEFPFKIRPSALFFSYLILRRPFTSYLVDPTGRCGAP